MSSVEAADAFLTDYHGKSNQNCALREQRMICKTWELSVGTTSSLNANEPVGQSQRAKYLYLTIILCILCHAL